MQNLMGSVISLNMFGLLMKLLSSLQTAVTMLVSVVQHFTRVIVFSCSSLIIGKGHTFWVIYLFLELVPIILSFFIWGEEFKNKIVNKRTSKSKRVMMLIRKLVFLTMYNNVQFKASHIQGVHNKIADALSRFQDQRFRTLTPGADLLPAVIPQEFLMIISDLK